MLFTKPEMRDLQTKVYREVRSNLQQTRLNNKDNFFSGFLKFACVLDVNECTRTFVQQIKFKETDFVIFRLAELDALGEKSYCIGAFKTWWCFDEPKDS